VQLCVYNAYTVGASGDGKPALLLFLTVDFDDMSLQGKACKILIQNPDRLTLWLVCVTVIPSELTVKVILQPKSLRLLGIALCRNGNCNCNGNFGVICYLLIHD
jgi:hypothetical protein